LHELITPQIDHFDESRFWRDLTPQFLMVEGVGPCRLVQVQVAGFLTVLVAVCGEVPQPARAHAVLEVAVQLRVVHVHLVPRARATARRPVRGSNQIVLERELWGSKWGVTVGF